MTTLGPIGDAQELDGIDDAELKRYMHHYNMPPYSTGEAKPMRSPGRREIGHGALAERAVGADDSFGRGVPVCYSFGFGGSFF